MRTRAAQAARYKPNRCVEAEKDSQALRDRLRDQLNAILQTRDTARGLIVSLSDVLVRLQSGHVETRREGKAREGFRYPFWRIRHFT